MSEGTGVSGERLIAMILLIAIAYTSATMHGHTIKRIGMQKYVGRVKEYGRIQRRHSSFYIGLYGESALFGGFPAVGDCEPEGSNLGEFYG